MRSYSRFWKNEDDQQNDKEPKQWMQVFIFR